MADRKRSYIITSRDETVIQLVQQQLESRSIPYDHSAFSTAVDWLESTWSVVVSADPVTMEQVRAITGQFPDLQLDYHEVEVIERPAGADDLWFLDQPEGLIGCDVTITVEMSTGVLSPKWIFLGEMIALAEDLGAVIRDYTAAGSEDTERAEVFVARLTVPVDSYTEALRQVDDRMSRFGCAARWQIEPVLAH